MFVKISLVQLFKNKHKIYKQIPTQYNYNQFSNLFARCKAQNNNNYSNTRIIRKMYNSVVSILKLFWKYVNS